MTRLTPATHVVILPAAALLLVISCTSAFSPSAPDYSTDIVAVAGDNVVHYTGLGDCYAAATLFTFDLSIDAGPTLSFSVSMWAGRHEIDGGNTSVSSPQAFSAGTITVSHWDSRAEADGELEANGPSGTVGGHWGCRFES